MLSRARALWRAGRRWPVVRALLAAADRLWWARVIRAAAVVDTDYVAAQLGRRVTARAAVRRYVRGGFRSGLRLNPLFVDASVGDHLPDADRVPALYAYLVNDPAQLQVSPLWDAPAYLRNHPDRATEPGGALGAVWRRREQEPTPFGPQSLPCARDWRSIHTAVVGAASAAHARRAAAVGEPEPSPERELIVALGEEETDFDESLSEVLAFTSGGHGAAAVAVTDPRPEVWAQAAYLATCDVRVRAIFRPGTTAAAAMQELVMSSRARVVVLRGPDQELPAEAARTLADRAAAGRVAGPLWLDADGTIAAAGAGAEGRILAGHPAEDAHGLSLEREVTVPALGGTTLAAPAALLRSTPLHGADAAAAVSRAARAAGIPVLLHTDVVVRSRTPAPAADLPDIDESHEDLLSRAGWVTVPAGPAPRIRRRARSVQLDDGTRVPVLRWALKTAAPVGRRGEWWGDTHFARGIAAALRRLGQEVVIDAYPARSRATAHIDDVTLVLRGPERIDPPRSGVSMIWIISHPDEVVPDELRGFDVVFAASAPWARRASALFSRDIRPLLQCTDTNRFHPAGRSRGDEIVFVGTARGLPRPSVVIPVRAGLPVRVYGPDWRGWIPARAIAGTGVPNEQLPALYEGAGVVLNDHWPAMKDAGFIGNRPFDVVAAGGRVISDHVDGIAELFGGAVVTYGQVDELVDLLRGDLDSVFPGEDELARISARVRERHSFDARARSLLDAAVERG